MADVPINAVDRRVQFTGNTGTGPFSFTFNILADSDIAVFKNNTLLTLTTDYTISTASNGTGSVTLTGSNNGTALVASDFLTIVGGRALARTTDFVTAGDLLASSLNEQLDSNVIMVQQLDEKAERTLRISQSDVTADMTIPNKDTRKGKTLAFNSTTGLPEAGPSIADVQTVSDASADIQTVAHLQDGTTTSNGISTLAGISSNISTVAGISSSVTTVAGIQSNIAAVVADATDIGTVASNITNVNSVAAKSSLITSDFVSDLNTLAVTDVINDINTLATSDIVSDLNTLATSDIVSDLNTLATSDIVSDINTLATSDIVSDLNLLATSDFVSDLNTMATSTNVSNLSTVAGAITNINTTATNISGVNSFAERYRVGSSDPTSSLDAGDLFYNTTSNTLKRYDGSSWVAISSGGITDVASDSTPQLGGSLDVAGQDIVSVSNGNITLTPNGTGVVRVDGTNGIDMESGAISIKNSGAESYVRFYCESSNAHYTQLQASPHSAYSGNVTVVLPASADTLVGKATTDTLTNKTIALGSNTVSGTLAQFNTAVTDATLVDLSSSQTLTNKSIAASQLTGALPAISGASLTALPATLPASSAANLTNIPAANITGTLPAIDGSNLTGISAGATGGGSDQVFYENGQTVTTNYTITNGKNAMSAGPITINSGVTVTVGSGETYTVV
tara:strand:+ start:1761 stop:3806 length:2046 start_codon:yes stop_codon:yes gene_type:complete